MAVVRPFRDADDFFLAGGQKYRLEKPVQILVRLKMDHSGFETLNNQRFGSTFVRQKLQRLQKWVKVEQWRPYPSVAGTRMMAKRENQAAHTKNPWTMMLKYWEPLREAVRPEF